MQPDPKPQEPLLIYDGDCSFCRFWVDYGKSVTGDAVAYEPYQQVAGQFPEIPLERFQAAAQFVDRDGHVSSGAEAIYRALSYASEKRWLLWLHLHFSLFAALSTAVYGWIARHRSGMYRFTRMLWGRRLERPQYELTRSLFLRLLGVIYLIAFASWWPQIPGLIGSHGILPAPEMLRQVHSQVGGRGYFLLPTLAWLDPTDGFISALAAAGALLSVLVIANILAGPALLLLWLLYLSQVSLGQDFMAFQWDALLLETGFLAIWLAPWKLRPGGVHSAASPTLIWLLRWLLFRVTFSSGMVKLLSGDAAWRDLTALTYHYETQPLPHVVSWYMHQLPRWVQVGSTVGLFAVELACPLLIFGSRRFRRVAAIAIALFQVVLLLTGNYAYFNLLTLVLCIPLLDDADWLRLLPQRLRRKEASAVVSRAAGAPGRRMAVAAVAVMLVWASTYLMVLRFGWSFPSAGTTAVAILARWHVVDAYGLFAVMTKQRPEIIIEGSDDGETWRAYEFRYKPGALGRAPAWVAPYQPRLDWQMWFASQSDYRQTPWFVNFAVRLLEGSREVLALLQSNPFPEHPPRAIRAILCDYHFTTFAERRSSGNWWKRDEVREYLPAVSLR